MRHVSFHPSAESLTERIVPSTVPTHAAMHIETLRGDATADVQTILHDTHAPAVHVERTEHGMSVVLDDPAFAGDTLVVHGKDAVYTLQIDETGYAEVTVEEGGYDLEIVDSVTHQVLATLEVHAFKEGSAQGHGKEEHHATHHDHALEELMHELGEAMEEAEAELAHAHMHPHQGHPAHEEHVPHEPHEHNHHTAHPHEHYHGHSHSHARPHKEEGEHEEGQAGEQVAQGTPVEVSEELVEAIANDLQQAQMERGEGETVVTPEHPAFGSSVGHVVVSAPLQSPAEHGTHRNEAISGDVPLEFIIGATASAVVTRKILERRNIFRKLLEWRKVA